MGITRKTTPDNFDSNKKWTWNASPNSIRIIEEMPPYILLYTIEPVTQENLVLASYWVEDHNRLVDLLDEMVTDLNTEACRES